MGEVTMETPPVERQIVADMARRAALVAPAHRARRRPRLGRPRGAVGALRPRPRARELRALGRRPRPAPPKCRPNVIMAAVLGGFLAPHGPRRRRHRAGQRRRLGQPPAARHHRRRHPPRPPRLGGQVPVRLARVPGARSRKRRARSRARPRVPARQPPRRVAHDLVRRRLFAINKVVLEMFIAAVAGDRLLLRRRPQAQLVPTGVQNIAESAVEFVQDGIIMQTIGPDGPGYMPFLLTLFSFILVCNLIGHHPRSSRCR